MTSVFIMLLILAGIFLLRVLCHRSDHSDSAPPPAPHQQVTCPTCGSPAEVCGQYWECGFCGDTGMISR